MKDNHRHWEKICALIKLRRGGSCEQMSYDQILALEEEANNLHEDEIKSVQQNGHWVLLYSKWVSEWLLNSRLIVWSQSLKKEKTKRNCIEVCHRIIYQEEITFDLLIWQDALKEILWYLYCYDVDLSDKYQEIYVKYQRFIFFLCDIIVFINDFCVWFDKSILK